MRAFSRTGLFGLALAPVLAQTQLAPPISSQLPNVQEEARAQQQVVPPARTLEQQQRNTLPQVYNGKLIDADSKTRTVSIATDQGPQRLRLSNDASILVNGREVDNFNQLPQGQDVRASYRVLPNGETLDLKVLDQANGPQVQPPRDQGSPSIPE